RGPYHRRDSRPPLRRDTTCNTWDSSLGGGPCLQPRTRDTGARHPGREAPLCGDILEVPTRRRKAVHPIQGPEDLYCERDRGHRDEEIAARLTSSSLSLAGGLSSSALSL